MATQALQKLRSWRCQPFSLADTGLAIAEQFRRRLSALKLIPDEEWDDGLILAETSLGNIPMLVTSDAHLLDMDPDALLLAFNAADLLPVHPVHPKRLLKALR